MTAAEKLFPLVSFDRDISIDWQQSSVARIRQRVVAAAAGATFRCIARRWPHVGDLSASS
jgi:hypothetical protein